MLPRSERLRAKADFEFIFAQGLSNQSKSMILLSCPDPQNRRLTGFIVSKKISKKACVRNRIKRQMREMLRSFLPYIKEGYLLLFVARKSMLSTAFGDSLLQMKSLLTQSGLYENPLCETH